MHAALQVVGVRLTLGEAPLDEWERMQGPIDDEGGDAASRGESGGASANLLLDGLPSATTTTTTTTTSGKEDRMSRLDWHRRMEMAFLSSLNNSLPPDIRVFDVVRATKHFDARTMCSRRRYRYVVPCWVLNTELTTAEQTLLLQSPPHEITFAAVATVAANSGSCSTSSTTTMTEKGGTEADALDERRRTTLSLAQKQTLEELLRPFRGSHNFHRYTVKMPAYACQAIRYITAMEAEYTEVCGWQCAVITVEGQSFMYNQIRRMIAVLVDGFRAIENARRHPAGSDGSPSPSDASPSASAEEETEIAVQLIQDSLRMRGRRHPSTATDTATTATATGTANTSTEGGGGAPPGACGTAAPENGVVDATAAAADDEEEEEEEVEEEEEEEVEEEEEELEDEQGASGGKPVGDRAPPASSPGCSASASSSSPPPPPQPSPSSGDGQGDALRLRIRIAPAAGLFLEGPVYTGYNWQRARPPASPKLEFESIAPAVLAFTERHILPETVTNPDEWAAWITRCPVGFRSRKLRT
eukprot:GHVU01185619.1.p1 GENE.GHVU01185619.1~~GHVU01185619.1.p1  ORF type:complete len:554 (-),score=106.76 GHVU01185619.1:285-1871(-)